MLGQTARCYSQGVRGWTLSALQGGCQRTRNISTSWHRCGSNAVTSPEHSTPPKVARPAAARKECPLHQSLSLPNTGGISPPRGSCDSSSCHVEVGGQQKASTSHGPTLRGLTAPSSHCCSAAAPTVGVRPIPSLKTKAPNHHPQLPHVTGVCPYVHSHGYPNLSPARGCRQTLPCAHHDLVFFLLPT